VASIGETRQCRHHYLSSKSLPPVTRIYVACENLAGVRRDIDVSRRAEATEANNVTATLDNDYEGRLFF
jgi:hypothetical protein